MSRSSLSLSVLVAVGLILLTAVGPAYATTYLATSVTQTGMQASTLGGYKGVLVSYNDTTSTSFVGFVYLSLSNSAGQSVYVNVATCSFDAGKVVPCFVVISPTMAAGNYTASIFATTTENVAVSAGGSLQVTV